MKRAIVLCLALIVSLFAVTGSIAYFTDNITTTNVVEAGNLHILQHEYERDGNGGLREYTQRQAIYPGVQKTNAETETVTVNGVNYVTNHDAMNGFVDKIVVAENGGTLGAYVRTFVAVPAYTNAEGKSVTWIHLDKNVYNKETNPNGWVWGGPFQDEINGVKYDIWYATSTTLLGPGDKSSPSLLGYYLDSQVNHNGTNYTLDGVNLGSDSSLTILVATEAAQAIPTGIGESTTRLGAVESLNTTYSGKADVDPGPNRHPWADSNIKTVMTQAELKTALTNATYNTQIGLANGSYELPETLPAGVRIFAMGDAVQLTGPASFSAQDVEFDSVIFENAVTFTGWGAFENCIFNADCEVTATNGQVIFSKCVFNGEKPTASETIIYKD